MKRKTGFVKASGMVFEIIKALSVAICEIGGNDGHLGRIITRRSLQKKIADMILEDAERCERFPSLVHEDLFPTSTCQIEQDAPRMVKSGEDLGLCELHAENEIHSDSDVLDPHSDKRSKILLGLGDAAKLLALDGTEAQIPSEMRKYKILFCRTELFDPVSGRHYFACLSWETERNWWLGFIGRDAAFSELHNHDWRLAYFKPRS